MKQTADTTQVLLQFVSDHLQALGVGLFVLLGAWQISKRARKEKKAKKILKKNVDSRLTEALTLHPEINPALCAGCGSCTEVCPEGDVLKLINHKSVLVAPSKCVGHGECEAVCPTQAITLVFGTRKRGVDIPRITSNYETNIPGLYIAGELGGMGLIRNAVKQGNLAANHALSHLPSTEADTDLLVIGAGPAGLSASLTAIAQKKRYLCIEQGSFGGTVNNFPRQKVVMTHPAELPGVGVMKFPKNKVSKEELLEYWLEVRKKTGLKVQEGTRFESLQKTGNTFVVNTNQGTLRARKVILAMGVRGSPRRLGLLNEDLPKVAYQLVDPEQYRGQSVAVVGGGNAGVEAAQYLAKKELGNQVTLLVRGAIFDRCNEDNKRIITELEEKGLVRIWFESSVREIRGKSIVVDRAGGKSQEIPNDYLFVFAGAESPHKFLMSLGVEIEKKFGEALAKEKQKK